MIYLSFLKGSLHPASTQFNTVLLQSISHKTFPSNKADVIFPPTKPDFCKYHRPDFYFQNNLKEVNYEASRTKSWKLLEEVFFLPLSAKDSRHYILCSRRNIGKIHYISRKGTEGLGLCYLYDCPEQ